MSRVGEKGEASSQPPYICSKQAASSLSPSLSLSENRHFEEEKKEKRTEKGRERYKREPEKRKISP